MKVFGKKIPKGTLMLLVSFAAITFCSVIMIGALRTNEENDYLSKRLYSDNTRRFQIIDSEDNTFWQAFLAQNTETNFILYCLIRDGETDTRSVYYKGNVDLPPILDGRFFSEEDCLSERRTVVIGKDHEDKAELVNGVLYYSYNGQDHEVIGIMGTERPSRINNIVLLNFSSGIEIETTSARYAVDGSDSNALERFVGKIESSFKYPAYVSVSGIYQPTGMGLFMGKQMSTTFYVLILASFLLSTIIVAFLWIGYKRRTVFIKRMLGYTNAQIAKDTVTSYAKTALFGFVIGILGVFLFAARGQTLHLFWQDFFIGFGITVIMGLLVLILPLSRTLQTDIEEELR